ncbi:hypothetical protein C8Q75DRAFT_802853 [Abortiporus biennis]|nr:hypothetical protein C8Q75DRAFT_802853 [Abortiporus biennis]
MNTADNSHSHEASSGYKIGVDISCWFTRAAFPFHIESFEAGADALCKMFKAIFLQLTTLFSKDVKASGEALTELAALNTTGVIHAVLTNEVDAFIFGAETVLQNPPLWTIKAGVDEWVYCTASDIKTNENVKLTWEGLLLVIIICGG